MSSELTAAKKFAGIELEQWGAEYRVKDSLVAAQLGARLDNLRELIRRNDGELKRYGFLPTVRENEGTKGRPGTAYLLNEPQALLLAIKSEAPRSADAREMLIRSFMAAREAAQMERAAQESYLFRHYFLPEPVHTGYLWSTERLAPFARLYGVNYTGGRPPVETRSLQRRIYELVIGGSAIRQLRARYPDPPGCHGEPYIYDHFHPEVRRAFEAELDKIVLLASSCASPGELLAKLHHHYAGRPLQLAFTAPRPRRLRAAP